MSTRSLAPGGHTPSTPAVPVYPRWHPLLCKPGQNKTDYRGELEVKLGFTVKAAETAPGGSVADLRKTTKGSLTSLNKVAGSLGGSLLSLGGKERKNIKKLAKSVGRKVEKVGEKARQKVEAVTQGKEREGESRRLERLEEAGWGMGGDNRDPGVNSDEEEEEQSRDDMFQFDRLSHRSSMRSELSLGRLGTVSPALTPDLGELRRLQEEQTPSWSRSREQEPSLQDDWQQKLLGHQREEQEDTTSLASLTSHNTTLADDSSLPSYSQAMSRKKKIIPVIQSEPESSPSPEQPSSPLVESTRDSFRDSSAMGSFSSRFRQSQLQQEGSQLGNKLKNSFSKSSFFQNRI